MRGRLVVIGTLLFVTVPTGVAGASPTFEPSILLQVSILGSILAIFVIPVSGVIALLKGHRTMAYISLFVWLAAIFAWFYPNQDLEDGRCLDACEPSQVFEALQTGVFSVAAIATVLVTALASRLARPASWWAVHRYQWDRYERAIVRYSTEARSQVFRSGG